MGNKNSFSEYPFNPAQLIEAYNPIIKAEIEADGPNFYSVKIALGKGQQFEAEFTNVLQTLGNGFIRMEDPQSGVIVELTVRFSPGPKMEEIYKRQINNL